MPYKYTDTHTGSDIGLTATGKTLAELFADSALGLTGIMVDLKGLREDQMLKVDIKSDTLSELYYDWLSEIIFLKDAESFLFKRVSFEYLEAEKGILKAILYGDTINPDRHLLKTDVKAVTLYKFKIEKSFGHWTGELVFDL